MSHLIIRRQLQIDARRPDRRPYSELTRRLAATLASLDSPLLKRGAFTVTIEGVSFPEHNYALCSALYGVALACGYDAAITDNVELIRRNWGRPTGVAS